MLRHKRRVGAKEKGGRVSCSSLGIPFLAFLTASFFPFFMVWGSREGVCNTKPKQGKIDIHVLSWIRLSLSLSQPLLSSRDERGARVTRRGRRRRRRQTRAAETCECVCQGDSLLSPGCQWVRDEEAFLAFVSPIIYLPFSVLIATSFRRNHDCS